MLLNNVDIMDPSLDIMDTSLDALNYLVRSLLNDLDISTHVSNYKKIFHDFVNCSFMDQFFLDKLHLGFGDDSLQMSFLKSIYLVRFN